VGPAYLEALRYERRARQNARRFRVFTNSMSDFFEDRRDLDQARLGALDTIRQTSNLDWLILTKRPEKIKELLCRVLDLACAHESIGPVYDWIQEWLSGDAPANVWLGTTVEDQERADQRIPALLQVPAAVRFLSCEPLLGKILLDDAQNSWLTCAGSESEEECCESMACFGHHFRGIDWVICGGESGPHARPMHPDWARGLRDQCAAAGVPFLFKQWGEWLGAEYDGAKGKVICQKALEGEGSCGRIFWTNPGHPPVRVWGPRDHYWDHASARVGKKAAGRLLDGVEHNGFPTHKDLP
jgi:protein gp37